MVVAGGKWRLVVGGSVGVVVMVGTVSESRRRTVNPGLAGGAFSVSPPVSCAHQS